MVVLRPEGLVELEEDLGVGAHLELVERDALPPRQLRLEFDHVVLQDAQRGGADGVVGRDAVAVVHVEGHAVVGVGDALDDAAEDEARVVGSEEAGCGSAEPGVEAALVEDEVVLVAPLVEGQVVARDAEFEAAFLGGIAGFPVPVLPLGQALLTGNRRWTDHIHHSAACLMPVLALGFHPASSKPVLTS